MIIIGQVRKYDIVNGWFELPSTDIEYIPNWNIQSGDTAQAICLGHSRQLMPLSYGMVPSNYKQKKILNEASITNGDNEKILKKRIIHTKEFRIPIRENRCIIPADYIILYEGDLAYLFFHEDRSPLAVAGVFDIWNGYIGFSILTFQGYGMFTNLGFSKVPMLVYNRSKRWINRSDHLVDITDLMVPYPDKLVNGYKVNPAKLIQGVNSKEVSMPIGPFLKGRTKSMINQKKGDSHRRTIIDNGKSWNDLV